MANEKRLIDANALIERLKFKRATTERGLYRGLESAIAQCNKAPTVDAVEEVHGEWEMMKFPLTQCSVCGGIRNCESERGWNYCPNCGAKMDGGNEDVNL